MQDTENIDNVAKRLLKPLSLEAFVGDVESKKLQSDNKQSELIDKFNQSLLDHYKEYPLPEPIILICQNDNEIPLLTLKSLSLWQGKQKSKKTTALALIIAAYINGGSSYFKAGARGMVLFFDTEQGQSYAARTMRLILKLANKDTSDNLMYSDLREFSPEERLDIIIAAIRANPDVRLVVIDGLVDLMTDFMDAGQGHSLVTTILKLCSQHNIHIAIVLHQNKGDKNPRAHVGTISSQKCEVEISTEVDTHDRNQSIVECVNSRGLPFEKFAIRWEKGSLPKISEEFAADKRDEKSVRAYNQSKEIAEAIFRPSIALTHTEAIKKIQTATMKGESTAKTYLRNYLGWGFVVRGEDGRYRKNIGEGQGSTRVNSGLD